jgi:hypothetical protein
MRAYLIRFWQYGTALLVLTGAIQVTDLAWRSLPGTLGTWWYLPTFFAYGGTIPLWIIAFSLAMSLIKRAISPTGGQD